MPENDNYKIVVAIAIGAISGLLLGQYIWGKHVVDKPLSKHLSALSDVLKQIEGINTKEASDLKERIHNILNTLESSYGNAKK